MSARIVVHCDTVHPDRTPPACRAFLTTSTAYVDPAYEEAEAAGWTQDVGNVDARPSCSQNVTGPGHPFAAVLDGTVDTRRPKTDGGPSLAEFLRSKGEL